MNDNERCERNEGNLKDLEGRIRKVEDRLAEHDVQYAIINTKLTAILWGVGVIGTALIGVLVKLIFKV